MTDTKKPGKSPLFAAWEAAQAKRNADLPPLPEPEADIPDFGPAYQASHMHAYARAAIAAAAPKAALTDEQVLLIADEEIGTQDDRNIRNEVLLAFANRVESASGLSASLAAALQPFAALMNADREALPDDIALASNGQHVVTVGDVRRARAALAAAGVK